MSIKKCVIKLGDVAQFINGYAFKPTDWTGKGRKIIRIQNLTKSKSTFNLTDRNVPDKYVVTCGDILVSWSATLGVYTWQKNEDALLNQHIFKVIPNKNKVDPHYLVYAIDNGIESMQKYTHGSTMKHINRREFLNTKIYLPPLAEQRRIAAILDKADELRTKRKAALDKLDALLESIFLDMFGDPVTNPKGWEVKPLGEVLCSSPKNGAYYPKKMYTTSEHEGVEMVHMSDAFYGIVSPGSLKKVVISNSDIEKYRLAHKDLLIARRSLNYEGAAKPCRIPQLNNPLIFESSLIRITPNEQIMRTTYLYHYLSNQRARQAYVYPNVTRSTISGINQAGLNRIKILIPSLNTQLKFEQSAKKIEYEKQKMLFIEIQQNNLFDSLQQRAFRGEL